MGDEQCRYVVLLLRVSLSALAFSDPLDPVFSPSVAGRVWGALAVYASLVGVGTVQPGAVAVQRRGVEVLARRLRLAWMWLRARHRGLVDSCGRRPHLADDGVSGAEDTPLPRASLLCDGDMAADRGAVMPSPGEQASRSTCLALKPLAFPPSPLPPLLRSY
ncbi:hypothetical protein B0H13DRAFT_2061885, partial [Mycena leptocephala]